MYSSLRWGCVCPEACFMGREGRSGRAHYTYIIKQRILVIFRKASLSFSVSYCIAAGLAFGCSGALNGKSFYQLRLHNLKQQNCHFKCNTKCTPSCRPLPFFTRFLSWHLKPCWLIEKSCGCPTATLLPKTNVTQAKTDAQLATFTLPHSLCLFSWQVLLLLAGQA